MGLFGRRKPNVKSLAKAGKIDGLVDATQYREIFPGEDGVSLDAGAAIREQAVVALGEAPEGADREVIVSSLVESLSDPVDRVRCAAVMTLYRLREAGALAGALATLTPGKGQARDLAARALLGLREPGSSATLASALLHRADELALDEADVGLVATLIDQEGTHDASRAVIKLAVDALSDDRSAVALRAEELLVRLTPDSVDALVKALRKRKAPYRAAAVLGRMKDARALEALVAGLENPDPRVRSESCAALGALRDPAAAEPLLVATRDPEYLVRARASEALDELGVAAIAVSVAMLLRPVLESSRPAAFELPAGMNGHGLPETTDAYDWELILDEGEPEPPKESSLN